MIGYILLKKPWYDVLAGVIKAIVGYLILSVGSGGLVNNFRPVLVGLKDRFNMNAMVIDPYFGQNAVTAGVEEVFGKAFGNAMILLLIAFIVNILLVRFSKYTKLRALFTTGHVQVQQAATAYWLILFACPFLIDNNAGLLVVMALILGAYWACLLYTSGDDHDLRLLRIVGRVELVGAWDRRSVPGHPQVLLAQRF